MWFIAAVVAFAFTIAVIAFSTLRIQAQEESASTPPVLDAPQHDDPGDEAPAVVWPRHMQSGGVLYEGDMLPVPFETPQDDAAPAPHEVDRTAGHADILMFVDYRCPACAIFEAANGSMLEDAVKSGEATLEVQSLTFLDRIDEEDSYSTRAAAAQACVIDGQPQLAWRTHQVLLDPEFQPPHDQHGPSDSAIADAFAAADGALTQEVRTCIEQQRFAPFASALNDWVFENPIPNAKEEGLVVRGTPTVLVNGVLFEGNPGDAAAFATFLADQGVSVD